MKSQILFLFVLCPLLTKQLLCVAKPASVSINVRFKEEQKKKKEPLSQKEIVKRIVKEKIEAEPHLKKKVETLFPWYEKRYKYFKRNFPLYSVGGGFSYFMDDDDIKQRVQELFLDMFERGMVITKQQFEKLPQDNWLLKDKNFTRILGADYLDKKFKKHNKKKWNVPKYLLVVDDLKNIHIQLHFWSCFPVLYRIVNGKIYAQKIKGTPVGTRVRKAGFGFNDYSAPGNIIQSDADEKYYMVDTEYRSFYSCKPANVLLSHIKDWELLCDYAKRRFMLTHSMNDIVMDIKVAIQR